MASYRLSPQAAQELRERHDFIAQRGGRAVARRWLLGVRSLFQILADNPEAGRARPELGPNYRSFPHGAYVIVYRLQSERVEVLRVLHGAQRLEDQF